MSKARAWFMVSFWASFGAVIMGATLVAGGDVAAGFLALGCAVIVATVEG